MNQQPTVTYFFLGANSKDGFYSLYDEFASRPGDMLHIIKSGPGTGKSTFMKRIGKTAEERGMDVEYILCSGDPRSLDGVYIPALRTGWVDGTAPHILEPKHFGIDGIYTDLGQYCRNEILSECSDSIKTVSTAYRLCYRRAYMYLHAAGELNSMPQLIDKRTEDRIRSRAQSKIKRELSQATECTYPPVKRFLRAISCLGNHIPTHTLDALCNRICLLESHHNLESLFYDEILSEANNRGIFYIQCMNPLAPDQTEAMIFPDIKLCFISAHAVPAFHGTIRTIHLDSYLENKCKNEYKQREKFEKELMDAAYEQLARAKQYHDELERFYRPALDTNALNSYTETVLKQIFA